MTPPDPRHDYQDPEVVAGYEAARFHSLPGRSYAALHQRGIGKALLRLRGVGTVLDVPCGTGRMAPLIAGLGLSYLGLDIAPAMARHCRGHHGSRPGVVGVLVGDIERLPFKDASIDASPCAMADLRGRDTHMRQASMLDAAMVLTRAFARQLSRRPTRRKSHQ